MAEIKPIKQANIAAVSNVKFHLERLECLFSEFSLIVV